MDRIHLKKSELACNKDLKDERFAVSNDFDINLHRGENPWICRELGSHFDNTCTTKVSPVLLLLSPNFRTVELNDKLRLIMDKDIYGRVADSRPLSRHKCDTI